MTTRWRERHGEAVSAWLALALLVVLFGIAAVRCVATPSDRGACRGTQDSRYVAALQRCEEH